MTIQALIDQLPIAGRIVWIGIRPERRAPMASVACVQALIAVGLAGDHYQNPNGKRQVTLIQAEDLSAIASYTNMAHVEPHLIRRNIVVKGINLLALKGKTFSIGSVVVEYTGECHPCSRMEENLGAGGYNAVRGHGGITARILVGGMISLGDELKVVLKPVTGDRVDLNI